MDKIHSIRQLYYEQGKTIPEIIAETGHDRKTITKYLDMTDFNSPEPVTPDPEGICPKLEPYKSLIDTCSWKTKRFRGSSATLPDAFIADWVRKPMASTALTGLWHSMYHSVNPDAP